MDVGPIVPHPAAGGVEPGASLRAATPSSVTGNAAIADTAASLLLSQADADKLIRILEPSAQPQQPAEWESLLRSAVSAAQEGDVDGALQQLAKLAGLDPGRVNALSAEPGLEKIRSQVEQLVVRLESAAGLDAQARLTEAGQALESWGRQALPGWEAAPQTLLTAAGRLYDAGGYANYLHSSSVAQVVIDGTQVPAAAPLQLSPADAEKVGRILQPSALPQQAEEAEALLRGAVSAAQKGDAAGALGLLAKLVQLDPNRAASLRTEPGLEPVRSQVEQLLARLEPAAGLDAQARLAEAAKALESWGRQPLPGWEAAPQSLLAAANRLYDAGGYVNYLHAAALAQAVLDGTQMLVGGRTDSAAALMRLAASLQLSPRDLGKLTRILEASVLPPSAMADLLRAGPGREEAAGLDAQARLAEAAKALESWGRQPLPGWDAAPQALLAAANRLYSASGYANFRLAATLAQVVLENTHVPIAGHAADVAGLTRLAASLQLSPADTGKLIRTLEPSALTQQPAEVEALLRGAVSATQKGDTGGALQQLAKLAGLDPNRANALRTEPGLEPIRTQVEQLLTRLESAAGLEAQARLTAAAKALESWDRQPLPGWDAAPQTLLAAANRLYDAGGYLNYFYAISLAQVAIGRDQPRVAAARAGRAGSPLRSAMSGLGRWLKALWIRAPLLILLVSWFALGLAAMGAAATLHYFWPAQFPASLVANGFALWGIGFLALIGFGFYMRVRHVRFR